MKGFRKVLDLMKPYTLAATNLHSELLSKIPHKLLSPEARHLRLEVPRNTYVGI